MVFATHQYESATGIPMSSPSWTPISFPSPLHPSRFSQSPNSGCPASYIKLPLVICFTYGIVYVPMLFSQVIPPSPSLTESKTLFFIEIPICEWLDEPGDPGRVQASNVSQAWMVLEATVLDDIIWGEKRLVRALERMGCWLLSSSYMESLAAAVPHWL